MSRAATKPKPKKSGPCYRDCGFPANSIAELQPAPSPTRHTSAHAGSVEVFRSPSLRLSPCARLLYVDRNGDSATEFYGRPIDSCLANSRGYCRSGRWTDLRYSRSASPNRGMARKFAIHRKRECRAPRSAHTQLRRGAGSEHALVAKSDRCVFPFVRVYGVNSQSARRLRSRNLRTSRFEDLPPQLRVQSHSHIYTTRAPRHPLGFLLAAAPSSGRTGGLSCRSIEDF